MAHSYWNSTRCYRFMTHPPQQIQQRRGTSAGKRNLSLTEPLQWTVTDGIQRDNWHKSMSYQHQCIWRTALNFLVAQTPQCECGKGRGLYPGCLLYEDKTCIFRTLLVLWKGHWLVWNIKQLSLSEIKRILEESGKLQKGFDGIYRSISSRYDGMKK